MKKIFSVFAAILLVGSMMAASKTVTVEFGSAKVAGATPVTDNQFVDGNGITWTLVITSKGEEAGIINNGGDNHNCAIGSASKPATAVVMSATIAEDDVKITDFQAVFGGAKACDYSVSLKVGDEEVASAAVKGSNKVTAAPESSWTGVKGKTLSINFTNPTDANVAIYSLTYTYEDVASAVENIEASAKAYKTIYNGQVVIVRDGVRYNTVGQVVE